MRDRRLRILVNAIEARWPGVRVVLEPATTHPDPRVRWWLYLLHCPRRDGIAIWDFTIREGLSLFGSRPPFVSMPLDRRQSARFVSGGRARSRLRRKTA